MVKLMARSIVTSEVGFSKFTADFIIKKIPLEFGISGQEVGGTLTTLIYSIQSRCLIYHRLKAVYYTVYLPLDLFLCH